jgi:LEA14-like dessication related protein
MNRCLRNLVLAALATSVLGGCATLPDPVNVTVAGFESLPGEGLEVRLLVKLRVQNPNDEDIVYNGAAVKIDVSRRTFATGVSDAAGTVPRFGEAVVAVPVTISALRMARQMLGMLDGKPVDRVQYAMSGKLQTAGFSAIRFGTEGVLDVPERSTPQPSSGADPAAGR